MKEAKILKDARIRDPYVDRRSGEDRRQVYDADYFLIGGLERRSGKERRQHYERRKIIQELANGQVSVPMIRTNF
jgi:hypothetical protein